MNKSDIDEVRQQLLNYLQRLQADAAELGKEVIMVDLFGRPTGEKRIFVPSGLGDELGWTRDEIAIWGMFKPSE